MIISLTVSTGKVLLRTSRFQEEVPGLIKSLTRLRDRGLGLEGSEVRVNLLKVGIQGFFQIRMSELMEMEKLAP